MNFRGAGGVGNSTGFRTSSFPLMNELGGAGGFARHFLHLRRTSTFISRRLNLDLSLCLSLASLVGSEAWRLSTLVALLKRGYRGVDASFQLALGFPQECRLKYNAVSISDVVALYTSFPVVTARNG